MGWNANILNMDSQYVYICLMDQNQYSNQILNSNAPKHIKHYSQIVNKRVGNPDHNIRPVLNYNSVCVWVGCARMGLHVLYVILYNYT